MHLYWPPYMGPAFVSHYRQGWILCTCIDLCRSGGIGQRTVTIINRWLLQQWLLQTAFPERKSLRTEENALGVMFLQAIGSHASRSLVARVRVMQWACASPANEGCAYRSAEGLIKTRKPQEENVERQFPPWVHTLELVMSGRKPPKTNP